MQEQREHVERGCGADLGFFLNAPKFPAVTERPSPAALIKTAAEPENMEDIGSRSAQIARAQRRCCCSQLQPFLCLNSKRFNHIQQQCSLLNRWISGSQTVVQGPWGFLCNVCLYLINGHLNDLWLSLILPCFSTSLDLMKSGFGLVLHSVLP